MIEDEEHAELWCLGLLLIVTRQASALQCSFAPAEQLHLRGG